MRAAMLRHCPRGSCSLPAAGARTTSPPRRYATASTSTSSPEQYLLDNGISQFQAEIRERACIATTLDGKDFVDAWKTADGTDRLVPGNVRGRRDAASRSGGRAAAGATGRCGTRVEGDHVTWSDVEALPPYDTDEDQKVTEVFNGVPWTRIGNTPKED